MAERTTVALKRQTIQKDVSGLNSLKGIAGYNPSNKDYELSKLTIKYNNMLAKQEMAVQKEAEFKAARDEKVLAEWEFHNMMIGAKQQVIAQYGSSSNEVQALGLKKKSEYKTRSRGKKELE